MLLHHKLTKWVTAFFFLIGLSAAGAEDRIYTWTDPQGVMHFSDQPPPKEITRFEAVEAPESPAASGNGRRASYDSMLEQVRSESRQYEKERIQQESERKADEQRRLEAEYRARIEAEQQRLSAEMAKIQARAVSPTFSQGMKQAQIDALNKKLEQLQQSDEAAPEKP